MSSDEIDESLCDCGEAFHDLDCAYLDALYRAAVEDDEVLIVSGLGDQ